MRTGKDYGIDRSTLIFDLSLRPTVPVRDGGRGDGHLRGFEWERPDVREEPVEDALQGDPQSVL